MRVVLDVIFADEIDFVVTELQVEEFQIQRALATAPSRSGAVQAICEALGFEILEYDTARIERASDKAVYRVSLRSKLWRENVRYQPTR